MIHDHAPEIIPTPRRRFLKAMTAMTGAAISCGILLAPAKSAVKSRADGIDAMDPVATIAAAPAVEPVKQPWAFPDQQEVIRLMEDGFAGSKRQAQEYMWHDRALSLVFVLWPAMDLAAAQDEAPVSEALYHSMATVSGLEAFVALNPDASEAVAVKKYLFSLPGYGLTDSREQAEMHNGYLVSQKIQYAIRQSKMAAA